MQSRRETNAEATRAALLAAAREHFATTGYSHADIGRIAAEARVTTGAIYHHFSSKIGLFQAVAEALECEILAAAASVTHADPWQRLHLALATLIDVCATPAVQRIIFVEAPQVIGPQAWRAIELRYALGALRATLAALMASGVIKPYPDDLVARAILALLREASTEIAAANHDPNVRAQVGRFVARMLDALTI